MELLVVGAKTDGRTDRQTNMTKLIVACYISVSPRTEALN